jgi:tRNA threonylcarbamoyladenosine biosynthesis protein TsaE
MGQDITPLDSKLTLADEQATLDAGAALAKHLQAGINVYLHGDLGAGKTTFARGVLRGLGFAGKVKSPTYTLVEPYSLLIQQNPLDFYHFDLYRFADEEEWEAAGFREYFNTHSVCLVEWPDKAGDLIPQADIDVYLSLAGDGRSLRFLANTVAGKKCLERYTDSQI